MQFARYIAILLSTCLAVYGALMIVSYVQFPVGDDARIDTGLADKSLFGTEPKYLLFSLDKLKRPGSRILFIGGSNVRDGFRPEEVQAGNARVNNLAVGASEIRESAEIVDLAFQHIPASSWHDQTFVLGLWYGTFQPDARAWPDGMTDIDREELRYGFLGREGGVMTKRLPPAAETAVEQALRPMLLISRVYDLYVTPAVTRVRVALLRLVGETPADMTITDRDNFHLSAAERVASLAGWSNRMGTPGDWDESQFQRFDALVREISGHGSRLVLLDLPLPAWHRDVLAYDSQYRSRIAPHLKAALALPYVSYVSMREGFADEQFYDLAHPRPRAAQIWADRASIALKRAMAGS